MDPSSPRSPASIPSLRIHTLEDDEEISKVEVHELETDEGDVESPKGSGKPLLSGLTTDSSALDIHRLTASGRLGMEQLKRGNHHAPSEIESAPMALCRIIEGNRAKEPLPSRVQGGFWLSLANCERDYVEAEAEGDLPVFRFMVVAALGLHISHIGLSVFFDSQKNLTLYLMGCISVPIMLLSLGLSFFWPKFPLYSQRITTLMLVITLIISLLLSAWSTEPGIEPFIVFFGVIMIAGSHFLFRLRTRGTLVVNSVVIVFWTFVVFPEWMRSDGGIISYLKLLTEGKRVYQVLTMFGYWLLYFICIWATREEELKSRNYFLLRVRLERAKGKMEEKLRILEVSRGSEKEDRFDVTSPLQRALRVLRAMRISQDVGATDGVAIDAVIEMLSSTNDVNLRRQLLVDQGELDGDVRKWMLEMLYQERDSGSDQTLGDTLRSSTPLVMNSEDGYLSDSGVGLDGFTSWFFNVLELGKHQHGHALVSITMDWLKHFELFDRLKLHRRKMVSFLTSASQSYLNNPYHNAVHAADVVHACGVMLNIPSIRDMVTDVEILTLLLSAAVHDIKHPGINNHFLIQTESELATTYNDRSVLENFHCAEGWKMLWMDNKKSVLASLKPQDRHSFRKLMTELILATDLSKHFEVLGQWKQLLSGGLFPEHDCSTESKSLMLQVVMKVADISNVARKAPCNIQWAEYIMEENYRQGDMERERSLHVSKFMDRDEPALVKCQIGFIQYFVEPLVVSWTEFSGDDEILKVLNENMREWQHRCEKDFSSTRIDLEEESEEEF